MFALPGTCAPTCPAMPRSTKLLQKYIEGRVRKREPRRAGQRGTKLFSGRKRERQKEVKKGRVREKNGQTDRGKN